MPVALSDHLPALQASLTERKARLSDSMEMSHAVNTVCIHVFNTLSLDMGHIQAFLQSQNNSTELDVKGIAEGKSTEEAAEISSGYRLKPPASSSGLQAEPTP